MITVAEATRIAYIAHRGQVDKCGVDYINHPLTVAAIVHALTPDPEVKAVAILHDVVEDCAHDGWTLPSLVHEHGLSERQGNLLDALTHRDSEPRVHYLGRIRAAGRDALIVKLADVLHNCDPARMVMLRHRHGQDVYVRVGKKNAETLAFVATALAHPDGWIAHSIDGEFTSGLAE